ncbi:hypothetical protein [Lacipirellula sp.]|uniref:hypothetical protein n=1 Tax=Lacipirellula sp. TaxID=2691419 RepID=UPI003D146DA6
MAPQSLDRLLLRRAALRDLSMPVGERANTGFFLVRQPSLAGVLKRQCPPQFFNRLLSIIASRSLLARENGSVGNRFLVTSEPSIQVVNLYRVLDQADRHLNAVEFCSQDFNLFFCFSLRICREDSLLASGLKTLFRVGRQRSYISEQSQLALPLLPGGKQRNC